MPSPVFLFRGLIFALFAGPLVLAGGCATDNDFLSRSVPGFEARSDKIPGLTPPLQRKEQIREKAKKGKSVPEHEREIMLGQLLAEYRDSPDQNIRREVVEAMGKIPHANRDSCIKEALSDRDPFVRISACKALATANRETDLNRVADISGTLRHVMNADADKDVRITAMRLIGREGRKIAKEADSICKREYDTLVIDLGKLLEDKTPSIRYQAMLSLHDCTAKEYGMDIDKWIEYIEYREGKRHEAPAELTWTERIPPLKLPMLM